MGDRPSAAAILRKVESRTSTSPRSMRPTVRTGSLERFARSRCRQVRSWRKRRIVRPTFIAVGVTKQIKPEGHKCPSGFRLRSGYILAVSWAHQPSSGDLAPLRATERRRAKGQRFDVFRFMSSSVGFYPDVSTGFWMGSCGGLSARRIRRS